MRDPGWHRHEWLQLYNSAYIIMEQYAKFRVFNLSNLSLPISHRSGSSKTLRHGVAPPLKPGRWITTFYGAILSNPLLWCEIEVI